MNRFPTLRPLARALAALCCTPALAATLPTGLQVQQGQAQLQQQGNQLTVRNSPGAILNWQSFSIGREAGVYFEQANAASKVLNRVVGNDPSQILGSLGSNGQVWLLNPHGVLFGAGARVDVASLVTSTLNLSDADFIGGRYRFSADQGALLRNEGQLRASLNGSLGGQIVLLGGRVENSGTLQAAQVQLVAARQLELVDSGAPNLAVRVDVPAGEVLNLGALSAPGGRIDLHAASVNQQGLVQADSLGTDAQGRIVLQASQRLTLADGSLTAAAGGEIRLLGQEVGLLDGSRVDASAPAGGGRIVVGGGAGGRDASLPNVPRARAVYMGPQAELRADATQAGDGGSIWLWSEQATRAYGRFSAQGGPQGGDGGFVETSGGWLDARPSLLALGAARGRGGLWLLDPNDIEICNSGCSSNISGGPNFSSSADNAVIDVATLTSALNAGTSVTLATGTGGANSQSGTISADAITLSVNPPNPVSLTLDAHADIRISNSSIASTGAALTLNLDATTGIHLDHVTLNNAGGDLVFGSLRSVCTALQGCGNLVSTQAPAGGFAGLKIESSTLQAGRIVGGGSSQGGAIATYIADSSLQANEIGLSARAEDRDAIYISASTLAASHRLLLDGRSDGGTAGIHIDLGSRLSVVDPAARADALLHLHGQRFGASEGYGLLLLGDTAGSPTETRLSVLGAALTLEGRSATQSSNAVAGLLAQGSLPNDSFGLVIDASAARPGSVVTLSGSNGPGSDVGLEMAWVRLLGPQSRAAGSALAMSGLGGSGRRGISLSHTDMTSLSPVALLGDGLDLQQLRFAGGGDLLLRTRADPLGPTGASIRLTDSQLRTDGAGARIVMEASDGAAVRGDGLGAAIDFNNVTLTSSGAGGQIRMQARGGTLGPAHGIAMRNSTLDAATLSLNGLGEGGADGLLLRASTLRATQLDLSGFVANALQYPGNAGIKILDNSALVLHGRGGATLSGDTVLVRDSKGSGTPASLAINSTGSMAVRFSELDFSAGAGTHVTLTSDSDGNLAGRVRLDFSTLKTGGGDFTVTGGSGMPVGVSSLDANDNPLPINAAVNEGASGLLMQGALIEAGSGTVRLNGRAQSTVQGRDDQWGTWGIFVGGGQTSSITAGRIELRAHGGNKGWGLLVNGASDTGQPGTALNLTANDILVSGEGVGYAPIGDLGNGNGRVPLRGVELVDTNSIWSASNTLKIQSDQGALTFAGGVRLQGGSVELNSSAALWLDHVTLQSTAGSLSATAGTRQGGWLTVTDSSLTAATRLILHGEAGVVHRNLAGIVLAGASNLSAPDIALRGIAIGPSPGVLTTGSGGRITATHTLAIEGSHKGNELDHDGIAIGGDWRLQAGNRISLVSDRLLSLPADGPLTPSLLAGNLVEITVRDIPAAAMGEFDELSSFGAVLAGLSGSALTRITLTGIPVTLRTTLSLPSRIELRLDDLTLAPGATLRSSAPGDAITLLGADGSSPMPRFSNEAGANALQTPNGRWLLFLDQDRSSNLGALAPSFTQYGLSPDSLSRDANGKLLVTAQGNGVFYRAGPPSSSASVAPAALSSLVALGTALTQASPALQLSSPSEGRTLDALPGVAQDSAGTRFTALNLNQLSRAELITLLAARDNYKKKVFADTLHRLQLDPALADVRPCVNAAELASGQCLITEALKAQVQAARLAGSPAASPAATAPRASSLTGLERLRRAQARKVREAALPTIARKVALLIGVNEYQDERVPDLTGALTDVRAVQQLLEHQLGYDTLVLENASKDAMLRALNQLALETDGNDSVLIYYAGHGVVEPATNMGYWLPADSRADQAQSWLSNADIGRLIALIGARQTLLVSDSCYSGSLAGSEKVQVDRSAAPDSLLSRKAVVVLASGGNEPVADTGRDGHSVFAWHLMERLKQLSNWQIGNQLYERIRFEVAREFPQTPRYGAARAAGHQDNTDYLFERRALEK